MLSHRQVAVDWVGNGGNLIDRDVKGSRMFHDGPTIYSYRHTWPIARFFPNGRGGTAVLMRTDTYSPSTSKHKHHVRHALNLAGVRVFNVYPNEQKSAVEREYIANIREQLESAKKPRIRQKTRVWHTLEAERWHREMCDFNQFYNCGWRCIRDESADAMLARVMVEEGI